MNNSFDIHSYELIDYCRALKFNQPSVDLLLESPALSVFFFWYLIFLFWAVLLWQGQGIQ